VTYRIFLAIVAGQRSPVLSCVCGHANPVSCMHKENHQRDEHHLPPTTRSAPGEMGAPAPARPRPQAPTRPQS
jgi:hypothetical protein